MNLALILELLKYLPTAISIGIELSKEFKQFKSVLSSSHPEPYKVFVQKRILNKPSEPTPQPLPIPIQPIAPDYRQLGPYKGNETGFENDLKTEAAMAATDTNPLSDDIQREQQLAKGE